MISALKKKFASNSENAGTLASPIAIGAGTPIPDKSSNFANLSATKTFGFTDTQKRRIRDIKSPKIPMGVHVVSAELQKKFSQGVNFNMKIIIRGDRNTGKTSLWKRLQGHSFSDNYMPTQEIQVTNITWNYRTFDHIVKLDVWDVVDEGRKKLSVNATSLKLKNSTIDKPSFYLENSPCDASIVDVYKNCNGVLIMFDVSKIWTWGYVQRKLEKIPSQIPVLVMANKFDLPLNEHQVSREECLHFLANFKRKPLPNSHLVASIRFTQSSMRNAHGLQFLYNFFNVPFLFLQRQYLETSLEANLRDLKIAQDELNLYEDCGKDSKFNDNIESSEFDHNNLISKTPSPLIETKQLEMSSLSFLQNNIELSNSHINKYNGNSQNPNNHQRLSPEVLKKKNSCGSISSADQNQMVDMYEEDFDSNDEMHQKMNKLVLWKPETTNNSDSFTIRTEKSNKSVLDQLKGENKTKELMLDSWFMNIEPSKNRFENEKVCVSAHLDVFESFSSSVLRADCNPDLSDDEIKKNPLVSHFSEDDEELVLPCSSDSSDMTPSSSLVYTLEDKSTTTSCSGTGFTHIKKTGKNSKIKLKPDLSNSSTLTSSTITKTSKQKLISDLNLIGVSSQSIKTIKTKKLGEKGLKKVGKNSTKGKRAQNNVLLEDNFFEIDSPVVEVEQYDPL